MTTNPLIPPRLEVTTKQEEPVEAPNDALGGDYLRTVGGIELLLDPAKPGAIFLRLLRTGPFPNYPLYGTFQFHQEDALRLVQEIQKALGIVPTTQDQILKELTAIREHLEGQR